MRSLAAVSFICSHSSTNPENLAKIVPADVEINGLREIVKFFNETETEHKPA